MRKTLVVLSMLIGLLSPTALLASPATASCIPQDGHQTTIKFRNKTTRYYPTNLFSGWVRGGTSSSITYHEGKVATMSAALTNTVSAEGSAFFVKASSSLGLTVSRTWSRNTQWSYQLGLPRDRTRIYRVRLYHFSTSFQARKYGWRNDSCSWAPRWATWQTVRHAPARGQDVLFQLESRRL